MSDRKVSVVVPAYNAERYLSATLNSILKQTLCPHEVIVVNDGSTDSTFQVISDFKNMHLNVILISQDNQGLPAARNSGMRVATGNYIAFCDSDDLWTPQKLENQISHFERHSTCLAAVSLYSTFTSNPNQSVAGRKPFLGINPRNLIWGTSWLPGSASSIIMRNNPETANLFFDESLTFAEDLDMWIQLASLGNICIVEFDDVLIRRHDASMQSVSRKNPNIYLISMLKIAGKLGSTEPYWSLWLIERLFFWLLLKEYLRGDREIFRKLNWDAVVESSLTLRLGRGHAAVAFLASLTLHPMRILLIGLASIFSKLKK
jgi:glycosyltransferase involved in cell wall biosynthesis